MDIEDTISIQETAKRLQRSTKTIYRWIAQGKLPAVKVGMQYFIKIDVVEALASGQVVQRDDVVQRLDELEQLVQYRLGNIERRLDAIELDDSLAIRIADVEQRLAEVEQERNTPTVEVSESTVPHTEVSPLALPRYEKPARNRLQSQTEVLPTGSIQAHVFAANLGINARTFRDNITKGIHGERIDAIVREKASRPGEHEYWLTPDQQVQALDFLRRHGKVE